MNRIDLIINNECVECVDDNKILAEYQIKEKMFIVARITQTASMASSSGAGAASGSGNNASSGGGGGGGGGQTAVSSGHDASQSASHQRLDSSADSSSDECGSGSEDSHNVINPPSIDSELRLPSVVSSTDSLFLLIFIFNCQPYFTLFSLYFFVIVY